MGVGPAALEAAAAVAGSVIGLDAENVFTGSREFSGGRCFAVFINGWPGVFKGDRARAAKLAPRYICRSRSASSGSTLGRLLSVISDPYSQWQRVVLLCAQRLSDCARRALEGRAV